jgi:hypothetical protein
MVNDESITIMMADNIVNNLTLDRTEKMPENHEIIISFLGGKFEGFFP